MDEQRISLGKSSIKTYPLGVGTWQWGDTNIWQYGQGYNRSDIDAAFAASIEAGITLFDTAEVYGNGNSERILGELARSKPGQALIATKFFPLPYRLSAKSVGKALDESLKRLGVDSVDLYQVHWPYALFSQDALMDALAEAVHTGKARAIGVSNYSPRQMERAYRRLARHNVPLASNQVSYSLLNRAPETNGLVKLCRELEITLIAYSPLAMGVLSGKYSSSANVAFARRFTRFFRQLEKARPVVQAVQEIAGTRGKTPSQVALNWLLCRPCSVVAIPGAKNERQARDNAAALGWRLSQEECERLDHISRPWLK